MGLFFSSHPLKITDSPFYYSGPRIMFEKKFFLQEKEKRTK
jgi:hypothetical protein